MPYARVLGMNNRGKNLISEISRINPAMPIVTSVKRFMDECRNKNIKHMLEIDIRATNIYTLGYTKDSWANLDYTNKIITL